MQLAEEKTVEEEHSALPATILCVDDEPQILSSLKRFFRRARYNVLIANDGTEALQVLEKEKVDLIISDMRMPEMTGAELLAQSAQRWPDIMRILLTGYADVESSIAAINEGRIYRYLSKPWDDEVLKTTVESALEYKALKDEKVRLEIITKEQNEKLKVLNELLEEKVKERTVNLQKATAMLKKSMAKLKESYRESILVFSSMIELRNHDSGANSQVIADFAKAMSEKMELDENIVENIYFAGLLNNIGKLGMNDDICKKPYNELSEEQLGIYHEYPKIGQTILLSLPRLNETGNIIRSHKERYDGKGYPDGLSKNEILLGSRILAIACDFYGMQSGELTNKISSRDEAHSFIIQNKDSRYDPDAVAIFQQVFKEHHGSVQKVKEIGVGIDDLRPDMVLTKNVTFRGGMLLLRKEQVLTQELIVKINNVQKDMDDKTIYVRPENEK